MKKRLLLCLSVLLLFSCTLIGHVNAEKTTTEAKVPLRVPTTDDDLRAVLDSAFETNKIHFGEEGYQTVKKILLTTTPDYDGTDIKGENWFSAYCLDAELKYPQFSLENWSVAYDSITGTDDEGKSEAQRKIELLITFAIANRADDNLKNLIQEVKTYNIGPQDYGYVQTPDFDALLTRVENNETVQIELNQINYKKSLTQGELTNILKDKPSVTISIKKDDLILDKYNVEGLKDKKYEHALWILEHSYPTLNLEKSLEIAGANAQTAMQELGLTNQDELDDFVYMTVQYAIWKVTGEKAQGGKPIGDTLVGSEELNKLFQYLIKDRPEHDGYLDYVYGSTFDMVKPEAGKEVKEVGEYYMYGPYGVNHNLADLDKIRLSLTEAVEGVSITNENGDAITEINPNEKFYIKCLKTGKITNVQVNLTAVNATSFMNTVNGEDERGRIYFAYYPATQNVVTGGILHRPEVEKTITLNFNPKTGNESLGAMFVIMLIVASLAFVGISYKEKPVGLN